MAFYLSNIMMPHWKSPGSKEMLIRLNISNVLPYVSDNKPIPGSKPICINLEFKTNAN